MNLENQEAYCFSKPFSPWMILRPFLLVLATFKDQSFVEDVRFRRGHFHSEGVMFSPNLKIVYGQLDGMLDRYRDESQGLGVEALLDLNDNIFLGASLICQKFYFYVFTFDRALLVYDWRPI